MKVSLSCACGGHTYQPNPVTVETLEDLARLIITLTRNREAELHGVILSFYPDFDPGTCDLEVYDRCRE